MRFGRKTVLDTDPPKKIKGRKDLDYILFKDEYPEKGYAYTSASFSDKGSYKGMKGEGSSYIIQDNMPFDEFLSQDYFFTLEPHEINREKEIVMRDNLREYYKQYPGTNYVRMSDDDYDKGNFYDAPFFDTYGRDELGTTYGIGEFGGIKYPAFIVTDPEVNTLIDLPAKTPSSPVPPNMELRNVMPEIYSRKLNQQSGYYIYETSEGTVKKKIGVEDARYIHQNRKAFNAMRKNR